MTKYYCNPINMNYKYQFNEVGGKFSLNREAADPSMVLFKGKYYLFPSMTKGFLMSDDLVNWTMFSIGDLPAYDYAPDVRVVGDYLYFCASRREKICDFYRTKNPESGVFECIKGTFDFWDPNLFLNDDGRLYFYWGCSNVTPIYGVELERETMKKIGEPVSLISNHKNEIGYERKGEDHYDLEENDITINMIKTRAAEMMHCQPSEITDFEPILATLPPEHAKIVRGMLAHNPYIEGAWMTKYHDKYYLQYASPGTEYNIYSDGVYISENPLGPFHLASNNPYSYSPGGFCPGAGHGSTMEDLHKNWWHTSTMRISVNHNFERRIGIWPCGFDHNDELFCNQRYGDWPIKIDSKSIKDPWEEPEWMLLSYQKKVTASSEEKPAKNAVDENVKTWWKAKTNDHEWLKIDLEKVYNVNSVQLNFADEIVAVEKFPEGSDVFNEMPGRSRYIDDRIFYTRWLLEGSVDDDKWSVIADKSNANTDLPHDFIIIENGMKLRYLKLTVFELPYGQNPCISGLRVFGKDENGEKPSKVENVNVVRTDPLSMNVEWTCKNSTGFEILWGNKPEKLYHNYRVFGKNKQEIRALVAGAHYYVRIDSFNESGITHGDVIEVKD